MPNEQRKELGCQACIHFTPTTPGKGECRFDSPTLLKTANGRFPVMDANKWCRHWTAEETDDDSDDVFDKLIRALQGFANATGDAETTAQADSKKATAAKKAPTSKAKRSTTKAATNESE